MSKTVLEILIEARGLLAKGWCQGASARKGTDHCFFTDPNATAFCVLGALNRVHFMIVANEYVSLRKTVEVLAAQLDRRASGLAVERLRDWNDRSDRMHEDIIWLFDKAIAAEKGELV